MNLQRKVMTAIMAIVSAPLIQAAVPLLATASYSQIPANQPTVPESLRITPAPPPPQDHTSQIFLFFAPADPPPAPQPAGVAPAPVNLPSAAATAAAPTVSFVVPKPPPHVEPPPAPAKPQYRLSPLERHMVASCLVLEAASQGDFGMRGVMAVIRNRAHGKPQLFMRTVLQQKQFSALNELTAGHESMSRVVGRAEDDPMWPAALKIVDEATQDDWHDPTGGATHYTRVGEHTGWTHMLARTVTIGRHAFYR